ncbi:MAG: PepSY domain-containing protein [Sphingomonadales bacterium]|nr:PepSY-associated TM helix domain-containing protein [Sphingomonas sp. SCN 67-18]MBN8831896.1 PepSY domain-containing protein [Sphingomonadales bacterium]
MSDAERTGASTSARPKKGWPILMRKYHRWVSAVAAIFLLFVSVTGVILQVQRLTGEDGDADAGERAPSALTTAMPTPVYAALVSRTLDAARQRAPNAPIASVVLRGEGSAIQGVVQLPGDPLREIVVDARSGRIMSDERREAESIIRRIHSGEVLGEPGVVLGILWGLALVVLLVTGAWVYLDMYRRRLTASDKRGLFW